MKYPCENCKLRAQYDKNPKSLSDASGVGKSISAPAGEAISSRCRPRNKRNSERSIISTSIEWHYYAMPG